MLLKSLICIRIVWIWKSHIIYIQFCFEKFGFDHPDTQFFSLPNGIALNEITYHNATFLPILYFLSLLGFHSPSSGPQQINTNYLGLFQIEHSNKNFKSNSDIFFFVVVNLKVMSILY